MLLLTANAERRRKRLTDLVLLLVDVERIERCEVFGAIDARK